MLRVALPNKGRLAERTLALFREAGLRVQIPVERALVASLGDDFQAIFVRAADVPEFVADGAADLGVTGADLICESGRSVAELLDLDYGACRLVVANRDESPIRSASELPDGTRVATAFPRLTKQFFAGLGIEVVVASVSGAAEIAPHLGVADVIVDLTSTGSTLRVNGLKELETVLHSTVRLVANHDSLDRHPQRPKVDQLLAALESVVRAREKRYLMANVPRDRLAEVREVLPGISGPTIVEILDAGHWVAAHAVVGANDVYRTITRLKALGAEGILVTRIERLMP